MNRRSQCWGLAMLYLLAPVSAVAEDWNSRLMAGIAFSGPVAGLTVTGRLSEEYRARFIFSSREMYSLQVHRFSNPSESKHYIFGAGLLNDTPYVRGAIGRARSSGPWQFSGELGVNLPLKKLETDDEGLFGVINGGLYLIFFGAGVHYQF